ncbi:MAG: hydantoinase B/oxoprolinase family protein [Planctomycetes bacterium]|nr:hydantoinase B/oxoprolinase family protein [Planctomycetota bacterium]
MCEEAGTRLQRSAVSPNIRERRDFSVAIFDGAGDLVAQAAHIPVHLGSAGDAVAAARQAIDFAPGDVAILNDPYAGGTHLPDLTMVRPVFLPRTKRPAWFLVDRAHHADIGGANPGSMGPAADLIAEGLVLPPVLLRRRGVLQDDLLRLFRHNVRGPAERLLDLRAQEASLQLLEQRLLLLAASWGAAELQRYSRHLMDYAERLARATVAGLRPGRHVAADALEDDGQGNGPLPIRLALTVARSRLHFDWSASAAQAKGGVNANRSVVTAACVYALRCLCPDRVPTNAGLFRLLAITTRSGTVVDPRSPAPVAGGNVETSQRLVDVAFQALQRAAGGTLPACSAGTMSNLSLGGSTFAFYETLPGGAGAGRCRHGLSAVQTHMTNTRNTPVEEMEHRWPVQVRSLTIRRDSGGRGVRRGGDGIVKAIVPQVDVTVSFLGERHRGGPPGALGGGPGSPGGLWHEVRGRRQRLPSKCVRQVAAGEAIIVQTPGGGGHGRA